jgi:uncharacterized protein YrrD
MQFRKGANVYTWNNRKVGDIERVVIDPSDREVTHVVVDKGFLFGVDKVVPVSLIDTATEDRVTLREDAGDLQDLPVFEETHYVHADEVDDEAEPAPEDARASYWYPPMHTAWWAPAGYLGYPGTFGYPQPPYIIQTERHIPEGTVALKEGAHVISRDGEHVGDLEEIFTDPQADRATHLLLSEGFLLKERKLVPTNWIERVDEDEIHLSVHSQVVEGLREYEPEG